MDIKIKSLRSFVGAKDFDESSAFYRDIGFIEKTIKENFSLFEKDGFTFYLSKSDVEDWINNTELFMVVDDADACFEQIQQANLKEKFKRVKIVPVKQTEWGKACYILDPAGVALCFGQFA